MSRCQYVSEQYLSFNPDIPDSARRQFAEASTDYDRRTRERSAVLAKKIDGVVNRAKHQARELLGAENCLPLRRKMRDERVSFRDLLQPPAGLAANYDQLTAARKKNVQQYLSSLKVDAGKLRDIYRDVSARVSELRPAPKVQSGRATWLDADHVTQPQTSHTKSDMRSAFQSIRPLDVRSQGGFHSS